MEHTGYQRGEFCYTPNMNRGEYKYKKIKAEFLKEKEEWGGWYTCNWCDVYTQAPELDHIKNTGMGGSPERLLDKKNFQILCRDCHEAKTNGADIACG